MFVADLFKSRRRPRSQESVFRHQLTIALRQAPARLRVHGSDRALLVWITPLVKSAGLVPGGEAGDDPAVASRRVQSFLALEIPTSARSAKIDPRIARSYPEM